MVDFNSNLKNMVEHVELTRPNWRQTFKGRLNEKFFSIEISVLQKLGSKNIFKIPRPIAKVMDLKNSKDTLTEILHFLSIFVLTHI